MNKVRGFEAVTVNNRKSIPQGAMLEPHTLMPLRGTKTSAGYDFYTPVDIVIKPQEKVTVWTDVKAYMADDEVLLMDVRSSMGIKNDLMLANTIGVIDSDYYNNESNEGNIGICLRNLKPSMEIDGYYAVETEVFDINQDENKILDTKTTRRILVPRVKDLTEKNTIVIKAGERVAQGFFVKYLESDNCNTEQERTGGIGSTTK